MSYVMTAKSPCLDFLITSQRRNEKHDCSLSLIMKKGGGIDWHANAYLTKLGGGAQIFNIKPLAPTVTKKAYSLNIFCSFLEVCERKEKNKKTNYFRTFFSLLSAKLKLQGEKNV